jgi:apolipoprotein N-acyltransferase
MESAPDRHRGPTLALGAAALSGLLAYLGTGLDPLPGLTWLAMLPVLLIAPRVRWTWAAGAAAAGWVIGQSGLWAYLTTTLEMPPPIMVGMLACYPLLAAGGTVLFRALVKQGRPVAAALAVPAVWTAGEYLVSLSQPHGAWLSLGYTQTGVLPVLQVAAVTGVWGVTFLITGVASGIAAMAAPGDRRGRLRVAASALVILTVAGAYASVRLLTSPAGPTVRVALLGGPPTAELPPDSAEGRAQLDTYLSQIGEQADRGARVVVLPEKVFDSNDDTWPLLAEPLARIATARHVDVVVGATTRHDGVATNVAVAFPADGGAPATYTKRHLIPGLEEHLTPGSGPPVRVPGEPALALIICKDMDFPGLVRDNRAAGASVLLAPAWDMGDDGWLHGRMAIVRGVEAGMSVARAGRNGGPVISDPTGHARAEADYVRDPGAVVIADVPTGTGPTPYARIGDVFAWLCIAAVAVLVAAALRSRKRSGIPTQEKDERSMGKTSVTR